MRAYTCCHSLLSLGNHMIHFYTGAHCVWPSTTSAPRLSFSFTPYRLLLRVAPATPPRLPSPAPYGLPSLFPPPSPQLAAYTCGLIVCELVRIRAGCCLDIFCLGPVCCLSEFSFWSAPVRGCPPFGAFSLHLHLHLLLLISDGGKEK